MSKAQQVSEPESQDLATSLSNLDDKNLICQLDHLSVIKISGKDASQFLHGQFTNDVESLTEQEFHLNGYCDPKGRLLALFYLIRFADHYQMIIASSIQENVLKRLKMYVLMADVEFAATRQTCNGLVCDKQSISALFPDINMSTQQVVCIGDDFLTPLADGKRYLYISQSDNANQFELTHCDNSVWRLLDIQYGLPTLVEKTQGCFVPQMMNLDLVNGLSFSKGCYPGQEVVARMHHLGKLKRRMIRIAIQCEETPLSGDGIYSIGSTNNESVGKIVTALPTGDNQYQALAVMLIKHIGDSDLYLDDGIDTTIQFLELPYNIPDTLTEQQ